jgi:hypothetical protein
MALPTVNRIRDNEYEVLPEPVSLASLGVTGPESTAWQAEAKVPEQAFEAWLDRRKQQGKPPTRSDLLSHARKFGGPKLSTSSTIQAEQSESQFQSLKRAWASAYLPVRQQFLRWLQDEHGVVFQWDK